MLKGILSSNDIINYKDSKLCKGETNDCVVRAVACCFGIDYDTAHDITRKEMNRLNRKGVFDTSINQWVNSKPVLNGKTIIRVGKEKIVYSGSQRFVNEKNPTKGKQINIVVRQMLENFTEGTFLVGVKGHVFTLRDGVIIGNSNDATRLRAKVTKMFQIVEA